MVAEESETRNHMVIHNFPHPQNYGPLEKPQVQGRQQLFRVGWAHDVIHVSKLHRKVECCCREHLVQHFLTRKQLQSVHVFKAAMVSIFMFNNNNFKTLGKLNVYVKTVSFLSATVESLWVFTEEVCLETTWRLDPFAHDL